MNLKKNTISKLILLFFNLGCVSAEGLWVKYGWELFDYVVDAHSAALGNSGTAYNFGSIQSSMTNPAFIKHQNNNISITHQSRFSGMVNSDLIGIQSKKKSRIINLNIIYQGISKIPDTRSMLLDWGADGQFGTNDIGEGNGVLDEGERLDTEKLRYFDQHQFGFHGAFISKFMGIPIGLGYKLLSYALDGHYALGMGMDIGYSTTINKSSFGLVFRNVPASGLIWDSGTVEGTKPSASIGLHHPISYFEKSSILINTMLSLEASLSNANMNSNIQYKSLALDRSYGLEVIYRNNIMIRFGKNSVNDGTGGIGLRWENIGLDYAFINTSIDASLGNHHLISISLSTEWIISKINS